MKTVRTVFPKPYSAFHKQVQTYVPVSGVNGTSPSIKNNNVKPDTTIAKTENNNEGISVCISAWNTSEYIEECLDSVAAQTWFKTHDNWEILLGVDGCEKTLAKVKEIMHKYKNLKVMMMNENVGTYVTCNTIMKEANYEWLMRFDSDDVMPKDMIEKIFKNNLNGISVVRYEHKDFGGRTTKGLAWGSHCIRKNTFLKYGGYRNWRISGDYDLLYRIEGQIKTLKMGGVFYNRRVRKNSLEFSKETDSKSKLRKELNDFVKLKSRNNNIIECKTVGFETIFNNIDSVAFIIPNRGGTHINDVINNINEIYKKYNVKIIIVNQCDNNLFMRGQLCNIGLKETDCKWVAFSDNDIIHFNEINLFEEYNKNNNIPFLGFTYITQIQINDEKYIKAKTEKNVDGAGGFLFGKRLDFINANGYSNLYKGWGCEDNEIACRLCNNSDSRPRLKHINNELGHITHKSRKDIRIFRNNQKLFFDRNKRNIIDDGINQIKYDIISVENNNNVTYINVNNITVNDDFKYKKLL